MEGRKSFHLARWLTGAYYYYLDWFRMSERGRLLIGSGMTHDGVARTTRARLSGSGLKLAQKGSPGGNPLAEQVS